MNDSTTPAMHLHRFEFRIVLACLLACVWDRGLWPSRAELRTTQGTERR